MDPVVWDIESLYSRSVGYTAAGLGFWLLLPEYQVENQRPLLIPSKKFPLAANFTKFHYITQP